ncbi:RDD family protein [Amycolatopsis sp. NPDC004368]
MTTTTPRLLDEDWWDALPYAVRRRDLRGAGAKRPLPDPPAWQRICAIAVDLVLHLTVAIVLLAVAGIDLPDLVVLIGSYVGVSFVHRVVLQWWWRATIGRALFGLRSAVATGARPRFGALLTLWVFQGLVAATGVLG